MGRLIDADALIISAENTFARPDGFIQLIEETETAYDVEKVVELINRRIEFLDGMNKVHLDAGNFKDADRMADRMAEVIAIRKIVEDGGSNA